MSLLSPKSQTPTAGWCVVGERKRLEEMRAFEEAATRWAKRMVPAVREAKAAVEALGRAAVPLRDAMKLLEVNR